VFTAAGPWLGRAGDHQAGRRFSAGRSHGERAHGHPADLPDGTV